MPRGPGKASNYNLDYSRFDGLKSEELEQDAKEEAAPPRSDMPPVQELMRNAPPELKQAYHILTEGRANGDAEAERKANELVLKAMQKASPEVQAEFLQEMAKRAPEAADALSAAVTGRTSPEPAPVTPGDLVKTIDTLKREMESGAEVAKQQMESLRKQQERLEQLSSPEDFFRFMQEEGGMSQQDLQRMMGGDAQHMEKWMMGMLDKATLGQEVSKKTAQSEKALKAAEHLHSALMGKAAAAHEEPEAAALGVLSAGTPDAEAPRAAQDAPAAAEVRRKPEEEVTIPDHRLQYEKDEESRYRAVKLRCSMPGVADMSAILLDVSEKHIRLSTCAPAPRYAVNAGPFPVLIDPSAARAKYSKRKEELSIEVPAKADG